MRRNVMPWPLLLWGAAGLIAAVVGTAAYQVYKEEQEQKEADARRRARERASREREEEIRKKKQAADEKAKRIKDEYGDKIPENKATEVANAYAEVLGELKGNREGLEDKGMSASSDMRQMENELDEFKKKAMKKK